VGRYDQLMIDLLEYYSNQSQIYVYKLLPEKIGKVKIITVRMTNTGVIRPTNMLRELRMNGVQW